MSDKEPDLLDSLLDRMKGGTADRLDQQMREAAEIKAREEAASRNRLEGMWLQEHERQRRIAEQQAEQRRQEQRLLRFALVGAGVIIALFIIAALVLLYF